MQGGAPNNGNPYAGYQRGYTPQDVIQGYPQQAGRGGGAGYYPPHAQQPPQPQQMASQPPQQVAAQQYGGYSQAYNQPYAARGGYQPTPPQQQAQLQQGYASRGGYYQGGGAYGGAGIQQGYPGAAAPMGRGGYGQGYGPGYYPVQQQQGYYNQGYNQNPNYAPAARGGFQGGAYGVQQQPQQPQRPQQPQQPQPQPQPQQQQQQQQQPLSQQYGRGGRGGPSGLQRGGRGGGRGRGGRMLESYAVVHLDSYAQLEEVGRKGATETIVAPEVLSAMRSRVRGSTIRVLVVIQKKYAAACLSIPRGPEDTLLSEKTAETFVGVPCVIVGHAERLVDLANGAAIQGAVFSTFRSLMMLLTAFDKPQTTPAEGEQPVNVHEKTRDELLEAITKDIATYEALMTEMAADSDESTRLFSHLMRLSDAEEDGPQQGEAHEEGADAEVGHNKDEEGEEGEEQKAAAAEKPAEGSAAPKKMVKRTLMSSPQGIRILRAALAVSRKRQVFFEKIVPPPPNPEANPLNRIEWSASLRLIDPLLHYPLLSDLVFQFFGVVPVGREAPKPAKAKAQEVKALCDAIARYGVQLTSSASCGNTILALLQAMDPQHAKISVAERAAEEINRKPGLKRSREAEEGDANADDGAQKAKTEEAPEGEREAASESPAAKQAPSSLAEYKASVGPVDWRLHYAVAESWCTGEQPVPGRKRTRFTTQAQLDADAAAADKPATVESRLRYVGHHLIGSFVLRYMVPIFADVILSSLKNPASRKKKEHDAFVQQCETILSTMAGAWSTNDASFIGGNVYRNLLTSLASRAVPGTPIEAYLRKLLNGIVNTIFESSKEKYLSHCVQEALTVARQTKDGGRFTLEVARALMEKADESFMNLAISPSGNYVVRHLCGQLTDYATGKVAAESEVVAEAKELEAKYYAFMTANLGKLSRIQYGRGLAGWQSEQSARLGAASAPGATSEPSSPNAE
ncbi:hypothetical protein, conserved [Leishmania donovani]|uniref:Uncharacterized protein n=1 Tax=Leishmania donovani TaxID=5661 RepID=E9BUP1_LEIDO|nr:hypothetical protein, conserved [Leishmania donovani]CBZ38970.1 hypothetical protein, conserved [Leishmania donovani]